MKRTVSALMLVYNETTFLRHSLPSIVPFVDEVVVVDGSPEGPSSDDTAAVVHRICGEKLKYLSGVYSDESHMWDRRAQFSAGLEAVTSEVVVPLSADMIVSPLDSLRDIPLPPWVKVVYCPLVEFWMSPQYVRVSGEDHPPPQGSSWYVLVAQTSVLKSSPDLSELPPESKVFLHDVINYHFGWIRPFREQVAKHMRHVKQGSWSREGELLRVAQSGFLEAWAIRHVLEYPSAPHVPSPPQLWLPEELAKMSCFDGQDEVLKQFEKEFGKLDRFRELDGVGMAGFFETFVPLTSYPLRVRSYMELGVSQGGSVAAALDGFPSLEKMVLFDFFPNGYNHIERLAALKNFQGSLVCLPGDIGVEVTKYFESHPDEIFDVVLVDGDHNKEPTLRDIFAVAPHSCVIVVHDIRNADYPHMRATVNEAFDHLWRDFWFVDDGISTAFFVRRNRR